MSVALRIHDETSTGERTRSFVLELASERLTARELLFRRVRHEVAEYNASLGEYFYGLVEPTDSERTLNGSRMRARRPLDADAQCNAAAEAFERNGVLMLAGDKQIEHLDEEIVVTRELEVVFLRLVPLVGG